MTLCFTRFRTTLTILLSAGLGLGLGIVLLSSLSAGVVRAAGPGCTVSTGSGGDFSAIQTALDDAGCATIAVSSGIYSETITITRKVTLSGAGSGSTIIDGSGSGNVVNVTATEPVTLTGLTIRNGARGIYFNVSQGDLKLDTVEVVSNTLLSGDGAGIFNRGSLAIFNSLVAFNTISSTLSSDDGGGIYALNGELLLDNSTVFSNSAKRGDGGGIYGFGMVITVTTSRILSNSAGGTGGGIFNSSSTLTVMTSTVAGNTSDFHGGGLQNTSSSAAMILGSTLSNNGAEGEGGGIYNFVSSFQGLNVTISGNQAGSRGGGVRNISTDPTRASTVSLTNVTVISNAALAFAGAGIDTYELSPAVTTTLRHVILAYNDGRNCTGTITNTISNDHNLQDADDCASSFSGANDQLNTDPLLRPLADYGGRTETHALADNSPAIDAGAIACYPRDQRGVPRPVEGDNTGNARCDIGAFEWTPLWLVVADTELEEGDSGTTNAAFEVTLLGNPTQTVTVDFGTVDDTALAASDYISTSGTLTFTVGASIKQPALVEVKGDITLEDDEQFKVILSNALNAAIVDGTAVGTILNDDLESDKVTTFLPVLMKE